MLPELVAAPVAGDVSPRPAVLGIPAEPSAEQAPNAANTVPSTIEKVLHCPILDPVPPTKSPVAVWFRATPMPASITRRQAQQKRALPPPQLGRRCIRKPTCVNSPRMDHPNLVLAKRYLAAIERGADASELALLLHPEVTYREHPNRLIPQGATSGLAEMQAGAERGRKVVRDQRYVVGLAIVEGDRVALQVDWTATLLLPLGSTPAGGRLHAVIGMFLRIQDGRIIEQQNYDCYDPF
jgi:ketosteroid isomerase-like protein